jgi:hypothetical protein
MVRATAVFPVKGVQRRVIHESVLPVLLSCLGVLQILSNAASDALHDPQGTLKDFVGAGLFGCAENGIEQRCGINAESPDNHTGFFVQIGGMQQLQDGLAPWGKLECVSHIGRLAVLVAGVSFRMAGRVRKLSDLTQQGFPSSVLPVSRWLSLGTDPAVSAREQQPEYLRESYRMPLNPEG